VLGLEQVGRHDNFFELGGHSLLVITVIEQLRRRGLQADVKSVFTSPTPSTLAHLVGDKANGAFVVPENRIPDAALADENMEEFLI
ncbi:syringomycin synthetase protein SyrE, partial [Stenotrophomonas lactitubi]